MNNYALMAALGSDAVAAVHGYRLQVISEAEQRGLRLVSETHSDGAQLSADVGFVDLLDIRLTFLDTPGRTDLASRLHAAPLHLVPAASEVLEWATGVFDDPTAGHSAPPGGVELDDDPEAIQRLLSSIDRQRRVRAYELFSPAGR